MLVRDVYRPRIAVCAPNTVLHDVAQPMGRDVEGIDSVAQRRSLTFADGHIGLGGRQESQPDSRSVRST